MSYKLAPLSIAFLVIAGCYSVELLADADSKNAPSQNRRLLLVPSDSNVEDVHKVFAEKGPPAGELNETNEKAIEGLCAVKEAQPKTALELGLGAAITERAVKWILRKIDKAVEAALAEYASSYEAAVGPTRFYTDDDASQAWSCFRVSRYDTKNAESPSIDVIGQFKVSETREYVQVRPLRLYLKKGSYQQAGPKDIVGLVATMKIDAIWLQGNFGQQKTAVDMTLFSLTHNLAKNGHTPMPLP